MSRVKLSDIVIGLESVGDEMRAYLDKQEGKVLLLMDDELRAVEEDNDLTNRGEWERENIELAKAVLAEDRSRFLSLPDSFDIHEWEMMQRFALSLNNEEHSDALLDAIHGRGAFRYFKDRIHNLDLAEAWYKFREEKYRQIALDWCQENGIEPDVAE